MANLYGALRKSSKEGCRGEMRGVFIGGEKGFGACKADYFNGYKLIKKINLMSKCRGCNCLLCAYRRTAQQLKPIGGGLGIFASNIPIYSISNFLELT